MWIFLEEELEFQRDYCEGNIDSDSEVSDSDSEDSVSDEDDDSDVFDGDIPEDPLQYDLELDAACDIVWPDRPFIVPAEKLRRSTRSRRELLDMQVLASQFQNETDDDMDDD